MGSPTAPCGIRPRTPRNDARAWPPRETARRLAPGGTAWPGGCVSNDAPHVGRELEVIGGQEELVSVGIAELERGLPAHLQICDRVLFIREGRLLSEAPFGRVRTDGIEALFVRTGDDARAAQILGREDFVREVVEDAGGLRCRVTAADVPRVAEALVRSGLPLHELTPHRASLEDLYLERFGRNAGEGLS